MNFQADVIEKSFEKPIVVDFWAEWCGPCKVLGPVIEKMASEQTDKWELVKINTEEEYDLAVKYRIQSIPNVKMFYEGEVIAEFKGALPPNQIQRWLDQHLPAGAPDDIEALIALVKSGNASIENIQQLAQIVVEQPERTDAKIALAQYILFRQPEEALKLVDNIRANDENYQNAEDVKVLADLLTNDFIEDLSVAEKLEQTKHAFKELEHEKAIQLLIDAVTIDKTYHNDMPRKAAIAFFRLMGPQHPLTKNYRWRFDMALY